jgi:hypothetical protein
MFTLSNDNLRITVVAELFPVVFDNVPEYSMVEAGSSPPTTELLALHSFTCFRSFSGIYIFSTEMLL